MGMIVKKHTVSGNRRSDTYSILYDTGASSSFIRREIADALGDAAPTVNPLRFTMADGRDLAIDRIIHLAIEMDTLTLDHHFFVIADLAEEIIIGADLMQKWKITLDPENETIAIDPRALYLNRRA